jgi:hypothetical protein
MLTQAEYDAFTQANDRPRIRNRRDVAGLIPARRRSVPDGRELLESLDLGRPHDADVHPDPKVMNDLPGDRRQCDEESDDDADRQLEKAICRTLVGDDIQLDPARIADALDIPNDSDLEDAIKRLLKAGDVVSMNNGRFKLSTLRRDG